VERSSPELALPAEEENPLTRAAGANVKIEVPAIGVPPRRGQSSGSSVTEKIESSLFGYKTALTNVAAFGERRWTRLENLCD
jgi:hypothetical protein